MLKRQRRRSAFPRPHIRDTKRLRRAFELAEEEARRLQHSYIGTEHILLGLLEEGDGLAAVALQDLVGDLAVTRAAVEAAVRPGDGAEEVAELVLTPRAKAALDLAEEEARTLGHQYLGTEHVLLGLIREGDGIAAGVLQTMGIDHDRARSAVIRALTGNRVAEPAATRGHVITCRVDARDLDAIDALVESGVRSTRSDAAAWLIHAGVDSHRDLLDRVYGTVAEIRRLRDEVSRTLDADERPA
jgi:ATP-dependent Clp protease ATP-binding subunit ClpC